MTDAVTHTLSVPGATLTYDVRKNALRAAPTRIVLGAGQASEGQMANRGAHEVAVRLDTTPVAFAGGHGGFNRSEWEPSDPDAFAATLREALAES